MLCIVCLRFYFFTSPFYIRFTHDDPAGKILRAGESPILVTSAASASDPADAALPPPIKVVPPGVKTVNVTKGFEVLSVKYDNGEYTS